MMCDTATGHGGSVFTPAVKELVAIGAAIVSNCEPCFRYHFDQARRLGVSRDDVAQAVATAQMVKDVPAAAVSELAARYTGSEAAPAEGSCCAAPAPSPCCP